MVCKEFCWWLCLSSHHTKQVYQDRSQNVKLAHEEPLGGGTARSVPQPGKQWARNQPLEATLFLFPSYLRDPIGQLDEGFRRGFLVYF